MKELNSKVRKNLFLVLFVFLIFLIIVVNVIKIKNKNKPITVKESENIPEQTQNPNEQITNKKTSNTEINYNNYLYKITYNDCKIYLFNDKSITSVCEKKNDDSSSSYEETKYDFKDNTKEEIYSVFNELSTKIGSKDIDTYSIDLLDNERNVLNWILLDDENSITFRKSLLIESDEEQINDARGNTIFTNSRDIIKNSDNDSVNKIASYINNFVSSLYDRESTNSMTASLKSNKVTGIHIKIINTYIGNESVSFKLIIDGRTDKKLDDIKGYTFNMKDGELTSIKSNDRTTLSNEIITAFNESDSYKKYKDKLSYNYPNYINNVIFNTGNYYIEDNNIVFIIPSNSLGITHEAFLIPIYNVGYID